MSSVNPSENSIPKLREVSKANDGERKILQGEWTVNGKSYQIEINIHKDKFNALKDPGGLEALQKVIDKIARKTFEDSSNAMERLSGKTMRFSTTERKYSLYPEDTDKKINRAAQFTRKAFLDAFKHPDYQPIKKGSGASLVPQDLSLEEEDIALVVQGGGRQEEIESEDEKFNIEFEVDALSEEEWKEVEQEAHEDISVEDQQRIGVLKKELEKLEVSREELHSILTDTLNNEDELEVKNRDLSKRVVQLEEKLDRITDAIQNQSKKIEQTETHLAQANQDLADEEDVNDQRKQRIVDLEKETERLQGQLNQIREKWDNIRRNPASPKVEDNAFIRMINQIFPFWR
ncbi:MAG: hypothetical protein WD595_00965 [Waddliaceae bacterium]